MDAIPVVGEAKLYLEGIFGQDLITGQPQSGPERLLNITLGSVGLGGYASELRAEGKAVTEGVENSQVGMCGSCQNFYKALAVYRGKV